uniref:MHC class II alpha chain N-terminal domain-containing protein n=1 Tax=Anguilla anguilla TaxID=7936 RepID=A0A0E9T2I1_ANGAN
MKSSVGPLLLLSLVAFVSVTLARSVFTFTDVLADGHCRLQPEEPGDKSFWTSKEGRFAINVDV